MQGAISIFLSSSSSKKMLLGIRHEAIMLQKLSIMLLSSAQKIIYYAFENCQLFPKLCHHNWPIYCCITPFSLMFKLQIVLNSLAGCCITVFHVNVTALLE